MTPTPEQIEAVARAAYERWRTTRPNAPPFDNLYADARESELADAIAAIAAARLFIRAEALEEAARVADITPHEFKIVGAPPGSMEMIDTHKTIAAAIRALKDKP